MKPIIYRLIEIPTYPNAHSGFTLRNRQSLLMATSILRRRVYPLVAYSGIAGYVQKRLWAKVQRGVSRGSSSSSSGGVDWRSGTALAARCGVFNIYLMWCFDISWHQHARATQQRNELITCISKQNTHTHKNVKETTNETYKMKKRSDYLNEMIFWIEKWPPGIWDKIKRPVQTANSEQRTANGGQRDRPTDRPTARLSVTGHHAGYLDLGLALGPHHWGATRTQKYNNKQNEKKQSQITHKICAACVVTNFVRSRALS